MITEITKTGSGVLHDLERLYQISVAQRMQRGAMRQTTPLGDIAYCLLEIFDVNIPVLYPARQRPDI
jgi:hypothetical protein